MALHGAALGRALAEALRAQGHGGQGLLVDLGAGVPDLRALDREGGAGEGAGLVEERHGARVVVADEGVVGGDVHRPVGEERGAGGQLDQGGDGVAREDAERGVEIHDDALRAGARELLRDEGRGRDLIGGEARRGDGVEEPRHGLLEPHDAVLGQPLDAVRGRRALVEGVEAPVMDADPDRGDDPAAEGHQALHGDADRLAERAALVDDERVVSNDQNGRCANGCQLARVAQGGVVGLERHGGGSVGLDPRAGGDADDGSGLRGRVGRPCVLGDRDI